MKAKLLIDGKEIEVNISEEEYKKLLPSETGYERVPEGDGYFYASARGGIEVASDDYCHIDNEYYESANYYSSETVAKNNARADKLMRQLRRFAVEHMECGVDFNNTKTEKHYIYYNYDYNELRTTYMFYAKHFGAIHFDSEETANAAIDAFRDELIWYFTEYKDSL